MMGRRGERESGISVRAARHDDDDYLSRHVPVKHRIAQVQHLSFSGNSHAFFRYFLSLKTEKLSQE